MRLFNQRQMGTMIHILEPNESVAGLLAGVDINWIKEMPSLGKVQVQMGGRHHRFATMVVSNDKTGVIERAKDAQWRRLDKAYVTYLHYQEVGWLKEGLEKGMKPIKDTPWRTQDQWSAHLLSEAMPKLDGHPVPPAPQPGIHYRSGGGGRGESGGWGESSDDSRGSTSGRDNHPESQDGWRSSTRRGGGRARASKWTSTPAGQANKRNHSRSRSHSPHQQDPNQRERVVRSRTQGRGTGRFDRQHAPSGQQRTSGSGVGGGVTAPPPPARRPQITNSYIPPGR